LIANSFLKYSKTIVVFVVETPAATKKLFLETAFVKGDGEDDCFEEEVEEGCFEGEDFGFEEVERGEEEEEEEEAETEGEGDKEEGVEEAGEVELDLGEVEEFAALGEDKRGVL
jgi:hypothetical protein